MSIFKRHPLSGFVLLVFFSGSALASDIETGFVLSLGKRVDSLDWNISGGSGGPNILSELEWRDLEIFQLRGAVRSINTAGIVFRGNVNYGWVQNGVNQDSDYAGNNRTLEFSRSISDVDGSRVFDLSGGFGTILYFGAADQYRIIPMLGYSYHTQQLRMTNGQQTVASSANFDLYNPDPTIDVPPVGSFFPALKNSYDAEWFGPWLGVDVVKRLAKGGKLFARFEAHWVNYLAQANWNLRDDFDHPLSFEHEANGRGAVLELGWQNAVADSRFVWGVSAVVQSWTTRAGTDRIFLAGGGVGVTQLNEVNWSSRSINLTLQKAFAN